MSTVRTVRRDELDELLELYRMLNPDDPVLDRDETLQAHWAEMCRDETLDVLGVEHDGRLVASCVLSITRNLTRGARPFAVVENVVTHEDYRGRGFGTQCVKAAVERAEARDCYKVMVLTGADREWKLEFYERCGFDRDSKTGLELRLTD